MPPLFYNASYANYCQIMATLIFEAPTTLLIDIAIQENDMPDACNMAEIRVYNCLAFDLSGGMAYI